MGGGREKTAVGMGKTLRMKGKMIDGRKRQKEGERIGARIRKGKRKGKKKKKKKTKKERNHYKKHYGPNVEKKTKQIKNMGNRMLLATFFCQDGLHSQRGIC